MVVNNAVLLLPITNSYTQVTTESDGEGGGTGSQASIKHKLLPCCLFCVQDVTNTYITLENQMIIIAGWEEVGKVYYFVYHAKSLEKNADPTVSQKRQWGVDGQAEVFRRTMTCTRWSRKTGFNADQRLTWICGDFTAIKRRKRRGTKIREVARKQRLLPSMI